MATMRELFDPGDFDLIIEAIDHRKRYYQNRIPQQRINAASGTVSAQNTLDRYELRVREYEKILSIVVDESM